MIMDENHRKLEALLEIMDCYFIDDDGYPSDINIHKMVEIVADDYVKYYCYKPDLVNALIRQSMETLDAYISDPSVEPKHIRILYTVLTTNE